MSRRGRGVGGGVGTSVSSGASAGASAGELTFRGTVRSVTGIRQNQETRQSEDETRPNSNYLVIVGF